MRKKDLYQKYEEERPISEIDFRDASDRLKEEYVDRY